MKHRFLLILLASIGAFGACESRASSIIEEAIMMGALAHDLDESLLHSICLVESRRDASAVGDGGESIGLCQVKISTALDLVYGTRKARLAGMREREALREALRDPHVNAQLAARYLRELLERFDGNETAAVIAYNIGPNHKGLAYLQKVRAARQVLEPNARPAVCRGACARNF